MLKYLTNAISKALGFSKTESRGTLVLIFIMLTGIAFSKFYEQSLKNPTVVDATDMAMLEQWVAEVNSSYEVRPEPNDSASKQYYTQLRTASDAGQFNSQIAAKHSSQDSQNESVYRAPAKIIDLNTASMEALQKVKGIGPAYSKRIVKYREKLGGFSSNQQLSEVYGLPEETINEMLKSFSVQTLPTPIDINADSVKVLARHPYISYDLAWVILNYRKQHGDISSFEDIQNIKALDNETLEKLKPYLH